jgi:hypothetical protein
VAEISELVKLYNKLVDSLKSDEFVVKLDSYIRKSDFLSAPASRSYHHSYDGGLLEHCLEVYKFIKKVNDLTLKVELPNSHRYLLAFGHDLSKTNFYVKSTSNKKILGEWRSVESYEVEDTLKLPHQQGSIRLLHEYVGIIPLEIEKAILYHHGAFDTATSNEFSNSCSEDPYTFSLHTADMISCILNEKNKMINIRASRGW